METLGKIITAIVLVVISVIVGGFYFMKLWGWFIVPTFTTLPVLTLAQSIGVVTFISLLKAKRDEKEKDFSDIIGEWFGGLIFSLVLFGIAYIIYLFIR